MEDERVTLYALHFGASEMPKQDEMMLMTKQKLGELELEPELAPVSPHEHEK
jgi:hypothetical protein